MVNGLESHRAALHCYSEQQSWRKFCSVFLQVSSACSFCKAPYSGPLKAHLLLIAFLAKVLFIWEINEALLKNNIPPNLPVGSSKESSSFEIYALFMECPWK